MVTPWMVDLNEETGRSLMLYWMNHRLKNGKVFCLGKMMYYKDLCTNEVLECS